MVLSDVLGTILLPTVGVGIVWSFFVSNANHKRRLNDWAKAEHLTVLEVRYVWLFQGPDAWQRSRNQTQYRVKVWDARGQVLHAWITLGTYWGALQFLNPEISKVTWK